MADIKTKDKSGLVTSSNGGGLSPPIGEIAFSDPRRLLFPYGYSSPYNPSQLVTRKGLDIFDKMLKDDQIKAAITFKKMASISTGWEIVSPEDQPEDWEVSDFANWALNHMKSVEDGVLGGCLSDALIEILDAIVYGYSITEKVYGIVDQGEYAGMIRYDSLKSKRPHDFEFKTDKFGTLDPNGLLQYQGGLGTKPLPRDKFVIYVYAHKLSNWYGESDLEAAYRPWWLKDNAYKWLAMLLERLGIPPVFGLYNPDHYNAAQQNELKNIFKNLQAATFGIIPRKEVGDLEIKPVEAAENANRVFIPALNMLNADIARAILMPGHMGLTPNEGQGSYAKAKKTFDVFMMVIDNIRNEIEGVVNNQIVRPLMNFNFPNLSSFPKFCFLPLTDEVRTDLFDKWINAVNADVVVRQPEDETHIRSMLSFPTKDPSMPEAIKAAPVQSTAPVYSQNYYTKKRQPNKHESRVDFAQIESKLNGLEEKTASRMKEILTITRDALTGYVERNQTTSPKFIENLRLKGMGDLQTVVKEFLRSAYGHGEKTLRSELPRKFQDVEGTGPSFVPTQALRWLDEKGVHITGVIRDDITNKAKTILLNALKYGETQRETTAKLQELFIKYIGDADIIEDGDVISPDRLEMIIRTNATDAFNQGRLVTARDPDIIDFMQGMEFSAVMDARTTPVCASLDGAIIPMDEPALDKLSPPLHFNALISGTRIKTERGHIPIEFVEPGTRVLTHIGRWRSVYALMGKRSDHPTVRRLFLSTGRTLRVTDEHPILTTHGWKSAGNLKVGNILFEHSKEMRWPDKVLLPNPKDFPSPLNEKKVAWSIMQFASDRTMPLPVYFNTYPPRDNREVDNSSFNGMLENKINPRGQKKPVHNGFRGGRFRTKSICKRTDHLCSDARSMDGVVSDHPFGMSGMNSARFFAKPKGPMVFASRLESGIAVCDRDLSDSMADRNAVTLAPGRQDSFSNSDRSFDGANRFPILPMANSDKIANGVFISEIDHLRSSWIPSTIISIVDEKYNGYLWNLAVEDDETYLAEGLIVHNCRSILVPIVVGEQVDSADFITQEQIGKAKDLAGDGFV